MNKEEIKNVIKELFEDLDVNTVENITIDSGSYDDKTTYTQININYVEGGESE